MTEWYVASKDRKPLGPYATADLAQALEADNVPVNARVRAVGTDEWVPWTQVKELKHLAEQASVPAQEPAPTAKASTQPPSREQLELGHRAEDVMGDQWHYSTAGQQAGPISAAELKQLASSGKLSRTDLVWNDGLPNWVPAETINGLFAAPAANTSPPVRSPPPLPSAAPATSLIAGLHRQRFAIAVAAGVGMLATFLPWVQAPIVGSVSGTAGDGWITLALFIPAMVLALRGSKLHPIVGGARLGATIPAGMTALIGLYKIAELKSRMAELARDNLFGEAISASVQIGIGIYVLIAAGVALAVSAWVLAKPPQDKLA